MAIVIIAAGPRMSESGFHPPDPPLSKRELRTGARWVGDGMRFVQWMSSHLFREEEAGPGVRRAVRECWLLYASRLHAFYYGPRFVNRALLAVDYFPDPGTWYEVRPKRPTGLHAGMRDLPSAARLVAYSSRWPGETVPRARRILELTTGLLELSGAFLGHLEEERLDWFAPSKGEESPRRPSDMDHPPSLPGGLP